MATSNGKGRVIIEQEPNGIYLQTNAIDESIYGQKTPNPKKIDTKGFLMDFGSFDHA